MSTFFMQTTVLTCYLQTNDIIDVTGIKIVILNKLCLSQYTNGAFALPWVSKKGPCPWLSALFLALALSLSSRIAEPAFTVTRIIIDMVHHCLNQSNYTSIIVSIGISYINPHLPKLAMILPSFTVRTGGSRVTSQVDFNENIYVK